MIARRALEKSAAGGEVATSELTGRPRPEDTARRVRTLEKLLEGGARALIRNSPTRAIDIGAGNGEFLPLLRKWADVTCASYPSWEELALAQMVDLDADVLVRADVRKLPFPSNYFGLVLVNSVLHGSGFNQRTVGAAMAEVSRVVSPGGAVVIGEMPQVNESPPLPVRALRGLSVRTRSGVGLGLTFGFPLRSGFYAEREAMVELASSEGLHLVDTCDSEPVAVNEDSGRPNRTTRIDYLFQKAG